MHKMAYVDDLMFYFGKNTPYAVFWHFCCSFKEKSTVGIILTTFLDILKNWKRQNEPYPFWRARALIWKMHREAYFEDFTAHFDATSFICFFWWDFWAIHIQTWLSFKDTIQSFLKVFPISKRSNLPRFQSIYKLILNRNPSHFALSLTIPPSLFWSLN